MTIEEIIGAACVGRMSVREAVNAAVKVGRQEEREACQDIADNVTSDYLKGHDDYHVGGTDCGTDISKKIGARGRE